MGNKTNIQNIQRKISPGKTRQRWQDDIKMSLKEICMRIWTEFNWLRIGSTGDLLCAW
jgi:hypothetical protein